MNSVPLPYISFTTPPAFPHIVFSAKLPTLFQIVHNVYHIIKHSNKTVNYHNIIVLETLVIARLETKILLNSYQEFNYHLHYNTYRELMVYHH